MPPDPQEQEPDISELRARADAAGAFETERDTAQRELAFVKAGIDTDSEFGQLLMNRFEGDLNDRAAIGEAAKQLRMALGIPEASEPPPAENPTPPEEATARAAMDRTLSSGQTAPPEGTQQPKAAGWARKEGMEAGMERINEGARRRDGAVEYIGRLVDAAVEGTDSDALYDAEAYHEEARRITAGMS